LGQPKIRIAFIKTETIRLAAVIIVSGGLIWNMLAGQWEHAENLKVKTSVAGHRLEIQLLEELVKKEPDNYFAWRELGKNYRHSFDFVKARGAWNKALEITPSGDNADKIKRMINNMGKEHNSTIHRHKKGTR
jgi:tetratricopeptide (TPR) repeat protein